MGQILSNLISILHGRKRKLHIENGYEALHCEEEKPIHPASGYRNTRVSEKDEGVVIIVISDDGQFREDVGPFPSASSDQKIRVSKDKRVLPNDNGSKVVEEEKPIHPASSYRNSRVSEKDEAAVIIVISDDGQFREDVGPFPSASSDRKTRVSKDKSVLPNDSGSKVVEEEKPIHPASGYKNSRVSEKDEEAMIIVTSDDGQFREDVGPFPSASGDRKTRVSKDKRVLANDSGSKVVEKIKPALRVSTCEKKTVSKKDLVVKAPKGRVLQEERRIKHYKSSHKILLVGEGDFSFSACLAKVFRSADNMVSTSLNAEGLLKKNYSNAMSNINDLKSRRCVVLHGVDATNMSGHVFLKGMRFDRIVFNFPYAGLFKKESRENQIRRHQKLVILFFKNAKKMLSKEGEIHISHKSNRFHIEWNIVSLASASGLDFIKAEKFNLNDYPGYHTKYGFGGDENFDCNPSETYMFGL